MPPREAPSRIPAPWGRQPDLWRGAGDAWALAVDLVTATGVWAAIGFGLDRLLGTWPVLFAVGAVAGHATGIYMIYRRFAAGPKPAGAPVVRRQFRDRFPTTGASDAAHERDPREGSSER